MKEVIIFYAFNEWHYLNISDGEKGSISIQGFINKFSLEDRFFSSQVVEFIKQYGEAYSYHALPTLIDIESYSKQFLQKSKPLESQNKWNLFKLLKEKKLLPDGFQIKVENVFDYMQIISELIQGITNDTAFLEKERFTNIEIPVNRIIYERQRKGIAVDVEAAKEKIQSLEEAVYNIKNKLQLSYKIFSPEKIKIQEGWLKSNEIEISGSIERTFKNYSKKSEPCKLFYELIRNQKDLDSFLDVLAHRGGNSRTFPSFHGFGTITSRITLREPALQNIRKTNRRIIKADDKYDFIYIDYSQFEAGILASLSKEYRLCKLYDKDIYDDMLQSLSGQYETRDDAKIEFYKFMYGSSKLTKEVNRYFSKFKKLQTYKKKVEKEATVSKIIGTTLGNYRNVGENISISLSHVIQATASLIFKEALIKVDEEIPEAEFVLPMHDAALYQVNNRYNLEDVTNRVKAIFIQAFANYCPEITPRVNEGQFYF